MNVVWNIDTYISVISLIITVILTFLILKISWKRYGLLFLLSEVIGV